MLLAETRDLLYGEEVSSSVMADGSMGSVDSILCRTVGGFLLVCEIGIMSCCVLKGKMKVMWIMELMKRDMACSIGRDSHAAQCRIRLSRNRPEMKPVSSLCTIIIHDV